MKADCYHEKAQQQAHEQKLKMSDVMRLVGIVGPAVVLIVMVLAA